jgi:hypothetical protein
VLRQQIQKKSPLLSPDLLQSGNAFQTVTGFLELLSTAYNGYIYAPELLFIVAKPISNIRQRLQKASYDQLTLRHCQFIVSNPISNIRQRLKKASNSQLTLRNCYSIVSKSKYNIRQQLHKTSNGHSNLSDFHFFSSKPLK